MTKFHEWFRAQDRYGVAMIGLMTAFLLMGLVDTGRFGRIILAVVLYTTLWFILYTSGARRRTLRVAWIAIAGSGVISLVDFVTEGHRSTAVAFFVLGALSLATPLFVITRLLRHPIITLETLVGAVVVYLLIGLAFTFILIGSALLAGEQIINSASYSGTDYWYLSFITMTTVGYGDVTPATDWARVIVVLEAIIAQLFLATVIARFASLFSKPQKAGAAAGGVVTEGLEMEPLLIDELAKEDHEDFEDSENAGDS